MGFSLVLEGGAMRGMYTAGVTDVLMELDLTPDYVVGVSAGAIFGVNYLSRQKGRVIRYNKRFNTDPNYMGIRPLLREGNLFNTQYAYVDVPYRLDPFDNETYMASGVPFYAVVTNIESGEPEYIQVKDVFAQMDVIRATGSMPFVSKPVPLYGKEYLDGGIADSIPFQWAMDQGAEKTIVVLTRDESYVKEPMNPLVAKFMAGKHPNLAARLVDRHNQYNTSATRIKELEAEGKIFVIRPTVPIGIGRLESDPEKLQEVYDLGVRDAANALAPMLDYLFA